MATKRQAGSLSYTCDAKMGRSGLRPDVGSKSRPTKRDAIACAARPVRDLALAVAAFLSLSPIDASAAESPLPARVSIVALDREATGYGTFQSHNQKVVSNAGGIFATHTRSRNEAYDAQQWRLSRSRDGGATFETIHEDTHATNPPVLETDDDGNVYLARVDFKDGNAYLYRFLAERDYADPIVSPMPGAAAGKYCMAIDEPRGRLYFFSHNETFHVLKLDGTVESSVRLLKPGPNAILQYPLLSLAENGQLHAAWTTQKHDVYLYWDIRWMVCPNPAREGGAAYWTLPGAIPPFELPVAAEGPEAPTKVSLESENEAHTWLSSFIVKGGKAHFLYLAQTDPPAEHYVRRAEWGAREIDRSPDFEGETVSLRGLDGFFATASPAADTPLYAVASAGGKIGALVSRDNGDTWNDWALSDEAFNAYSIGGCRATGPDGAILGTFTDQRDATPADAEKFATVYFFRIDPNE